MPHNQKVRDVHAAARMAAGAGPMNAPAPPWWRRWWPTPVRQRPDIAARHPAAPIAGAGRAGGQDRWDRPAAASAADESPDQGVAALLQAQWHALALEPLSRGPDQVLNRPLHDAVATALATRDWASRQLPRRPQLLPQLIQTVNDPAASARGVAGIVGQDAVLTGNLLRIANSPLFRIQDRPVDSLQRAVTLVGTDGIRQIISAVLVRPVMQLQCAVFPHFGATIWEQALLASRAAADHARTLGQGDPFAAQWLGLTEGLGAALVMKQLMHEAAQREEVPDAATARVLLQAWTLPVAQRVATAWELPPAVRAALAVQSEGTGLPASLQFARAAAAASLLCRHGRMGQAQAIALLEQVPGAPCQALEGLWRRLHGRPVETVDEDESRNARA